jgi:hypothetical protein
MIGVGGRRILISDYDQEVKGYSKVKGEFGEGDVETLLFTVLAKVDVLSGNKALQYQEQGINNPVVIEMNWTDVIPSYLIWNGREIPVVSFNDPDNHMKRRVRILGSYTE